MKKQKVKIGDTILLGTKGIWTLTHIEKNIFYAGGLKVGSINDLYLKFSQKELKYINKYTKKFRIGDFVIGKYFDDVLNNYKMGKIQFIFKNSLENSIWICDADGITFPLIEETIQKIKKDFSKEEINCFLEKRNDFIKYLEEKSYN